MDESGLVHCKLSFRTFLVDHYFAGNPNNSFYSRTSGTKKSIEEVALLFLFFAHLH